MSIVLSHTESGARSWTASNFYASKGQTGRFLNARRSIIFDVRNVQFLHALEQERMQDLICSVLLNFFLDNDDEHDAKRRNVQGCGSG